MNKVLYDFFTISLTLIEYEEKTKPWSLLATNK